MSESLFEVTTTSTNQEIVFEKNIVRIPFNTSDERDKKIYEILTNLQKKIETLEKERSQVNFFSLTKEQIREKVIRFLKDKKQSGHGKIEVFELSFSLKIPAPQIEEILDELEKEGVIKTLE